MSICRRSGLLSVHFWSWITHEGVGMLHRTVGHLDGFHYKHILQKVMVPSIRMLYPDGTIQFQQDHYSIHDSRVVQEWLSL